MTSWTDHLPPMPHLGDEMPQPSVQQSTLNYLATRRSLTAAQMQDPGPSAQETAALLRIAARVPDHRRVHPFRFITFEGEARGVFGDVLASAFAASHRDATDAVLAIERGRFLRAPLVVAVISSVNKGHKTPEWEQVLTAGAVAQNLVIAAGAAGYAAQWLTEWYAFDSNVAEAMRLEANERVAGFVYIGTAAALPKERARSDAHELTSVWTS